MYAQQQHSTAQHESLRGPAEGADIAARMAAASMPAPAPPRLPYGAFAAAHPPTGQAASLLACTSAAAQGCGGLPRDGACTGSTQVPAGAAKPAHPGSAAGASLDHGSLSPDPPRTPTTAAHACELGGPIAAERTPEPGSERAAADGKDAWFEDPDGRHSPDAVLAWADAWSAPAQRTTAGSGTQQMRSDMAEVDSEAWRERLMGALAGGLSSQDGAALGAGLGGRPVGATRVTAFSGADDSLGLRMEPCGNCMERHEDVACLMQQDDFNARLSQMSHCKHTSSNCKNSTALCHSGPKMPVSVGHELH